MEKEKSTNQAEKHPEIQNLRLFFKDFAENGGSVTAFAKKLDMCEQQMSSYLKGEHVPSKRTVRQWAMYFGVDYATMTTANFAYIPYPLERFSKPRKGGLHITMEYVNEELDALKTDLIKVCEDNDIDYALFQDVFDKHRNYRKKPSRS